MDKTNSKKRTTRNKRYDRKTGKDKTYRDQNQEILDSTGRDNDPNWYFLDRNIADQASSFSFDQFLGLKFPIKHFNTYGLEITSYMYTPTIMSYQVAPAPGDTKSIQTGINIAGLKMYSQLSSQNAKTTNYAPQDLTMLILAMGELVSIIEHMRRAFGVAFTYNQRNRSMPVRLLEHMGFGGEDFLDSLADKRLAFNSVISSFNRIPFLDNIAYIFKCADMYQGVYTDSTSTMAQVHFMRPGLTWILDETGSEEGSVLKTIDVSEYNTYEQWLTLARNMITALLSSSTLNYIYSDVLNYSSKFGAKLLYLDYLMETYVVVPTYNRNFNMQMHNATLVGKPLETPGADFTNFNDVMPDVDTNRIVYNPEFSAATVQTPVINLDVDSASVVDRIEFTRYTAVIGETVSDTEPKVYNHPALALPDHYIIGLKFDKWADEEVSLTNNHVHIDASTTALALSNYLRMVQFDWAPMLYLTGIGEYGVQSNMVYGDLNYYTTLPKEWFQRVNDLTFQALFALRDRKSVV